MATRQTDGSQQPGPDHIDQIREIILGPQKRHFDGLLDELRKELDATRKELAGLRKTVEQNQTTVNHDLMSGLQQMREADAAVRQEVVRLTGATESDLRALHESLASELHAHIEALRERKVSADALAELLQELAIKLKGIHLMQELEQAAGKRLGT